ncbi:asparagine synthase (glutamine-hydrolyzing) [bacterium]|nr:asparagine synthase (glutamine-hydrolyzing) [bacterium]
MCGICGIIYKDPQRRPDAAMLERMNATITHRGPDEDGLIVTGQAGLAMRRLSIIDLSTGQQPIANEDNTVHIVFNGEIYNFATVKSDLEGLGHHFKTKADTEVILHGAEAWGRDVAKRLNGMFAFAVWDAGTRRLLLGRDRLGIKPLYVYEDDEKLVFGSEIKAILEADDLSLSLDIEALNNFLTFEYIPAPRSIFKEIRKLEPGHTLVMENGRTVTVPYWTLEPTDGVMSEAEAREELSATLQDAVKLRLLSDVPLGAFLSGGIDSSVMVALMAGLTDRPVKTFTIGFKESSYNELKYAKAVSEMYGTEHHEYILEANALDLTEKLMRQLDEPFGDFSVFPTYMVSQIARENVTVALSGDGGDELFAGYDTYKAHKFDRAIYHWLPKVVKRHGFGALARRLPPTAQKKGLVNSFKRFIQGSELPKELLHTRWMTFLAESERQRLFSAGTLEALSGTDSFDFIRRHAASVEGLNDITRTGYVDVKTYLTDNILVKVDRMSMVPSLEARVPFLDHRVVELAFRMPPALKMRGYDTKYILKKTFWDKLPIEVQRRGKQGFSIPIKEWLKDELKPMATALFDERRLREQGLFDPAFVGQLMDEHCRNVDNHSHKLWALMVFQQWMDNYGHHLTK